MVSQHWSSCTSKITVAIVLMFAHGLVTDDVTGFRGQKRTTFSAFSREVGEDRRKARDVNVTSGDTDVIYTERDVIGNKVRCPSDCDCLYPGNSSLELHCESWTAETNAYLLSLALKLTELEIISTPLTAVPEPVCQLQRLTTLSLIGNQLLNRLPDNCFTRLRELMSFRAIYNGLTVLQGGLFDNLTKLHYVSFTNNRISSIGAHLFDVTANLPNLSYIDLSINNLTEIDSWPVQRAQLYGGSATDLRYNRISRFTNSLQWHYDCNSINATIIDLRYNDIRHLNEFFNGWNITGLCRQID